MIERHPDNITAAMMGGFCGSFLRDLTPQEVERREIPLAEVLPEPSGGEDTGLVPPLPPTDIGRHVKYQWNPPLNVLRSSHSSSCPPPTPERPSKSLPNPGLGFQSTKIGRLDHSFDHGPT